MGFEIPLDSDYPQHPKILDLISRIGPYADIYPIRLWLWAAKYARDGIVKGGWRQIERACGWSGTPHHLTRTMRRVGLLESDEMTIHGWMDGMGRAIALYERKKQKQREKYAIDKGSLPEVFRQNSSNPSNPSNPSKGNAADAETASPPRPLNGDMNDQLAEEWSRYLTVVYRTTTQGPDGPWIPKDIKAAILRKLKPGDIEARFMDEKNSGRKHSEIFYEMENPHGRGKLPGAPPPKLRV